MKFTLTDLPAGVTDVKAVVEVDDDYGGYVLCSRRARSHDEWVTWRYFRSEGRVTYSWGHYFQDVDDAWRDLFKRTGFGEVEQRGCWPSVHRCVEGSTARVEVLESELEAISSQLRREGYAALAERIAALSTGEPS